MKYPGNTHVPENTLVFLLTNGEIDVVSIREQSYQGKFVGMYERDGCKFSVTDHYTYVQGMRVNYFFLSISCDDELICERAVDKRIVGLAGLSANEDVRETVRIMLEHVPLIQLVVKAFLTGKLVGVREASEAVLSITKGAS